MNMKELSDVEPMYYHFLSLLFLLFWLLKKKEK